MFLSQNRWSFLEKQNRSWLNFAEKIEVNTGLLLKWLNVKKNEKNIDKLVHNNECRILNSLLNIQFLPLYWLCLTRLKLLINVYYYLKLFFFQNHITKFATFYWKLFEYSIQLIQECSSYISSSLPRQLIFPWGRMGSRTKKNVGIWKLNY